MSPKRYAALNRSVMLTLFFVPLLFIAFWETNLDTSTNKFMKSWFGASDEGEEDDPAVQDPEVTVAFTHPENLIDSGAGEGTNGESVGELKISRVPFSELVKELPDVSVSAEGNIIKEIHALKEQIEVLTKALEVIVREKSKD